MVIRREAMASNGIGTAAAAAANLRRANLAFAKHDGFPELRDHGIPVASWTKTS